jgi:hypothetical protein
MNRIAPLVLAALMLWGPQAAAEDAPTRRLEDVDLSAPPPRLDYKSYRAQVYADGYRIVASRSNRMAYMRRSLAEVPEAHELIEKRSYRTNLGAALLVSGAGVALASVAAQSVGVTSSTRGQTLGLLSMGAGVTLFIIAPPVKRSTDIYNDWAREQGIPSWP